GRAQCSTAPHFAKFVIFARTFARGGAAEWDRHLACRRQAGSLRHLGFSSGGLGTVRPALKDETFIPASYLFRISSKNSAPSLEFMMDNCSTAFFFNSGSVSLRAISTMALALPCINSASITFLRIFLSFSFAYIFTNVSAVFCEPI